MTEQETKLVLDDEDFPELRSEVRKLCEKYPSKYWLDLENQPRTQVIQPNLFRNSLMLATSPLLFLRNMVVRDFRYGPVP